MKLHAKKRRIAYQTIYAYTLVAVLVALLLLMASCIPAQVPPQLAHTPGAPITIDEDTIEVGDFTVGYPRGWRVVKLNVAGTPPWLAFINPDETLRIEVRAIPFDDDAEPMLSDTVALLDATIYLRGSAEADEMGQLETYFQWIRDRISRIS